MRIPIWPIPIWPIPIWPLAGLCLVLASYAQSVPAQDQSPSTTSVPILRPSWQQKLLKSAPPLSGYGDTAARAASDFLDWAASSPVTQREEARKAIWGARDNQDIATALCKEAIVSMPLDHSRALVALSVIGELRSPVGMRCLIDVVRMPLPDKVTEVDGEFVEHTALGMLQAKAVEGLAYLQLPEGDKEVLRSVAVHPSPIVRAAAINAYLWNHGDTAEAKAALALYVRKGEAIYIDRPRRDPIEQGKDFNRRLEAYLKLHPEAIAPAPVQAKPGAPERPYDQLPPQR